jgi:hypothetical protein
MVTEEVHQAAAGEPRERWIRWITWTAVAVGVLPILVAGVRAAARGWTPTGDDAYSAVRGWDVLSSNPPLLATWSSASIYTGHQINHPGALHFDLLAVPIRLLGHGPGTAVGTALVNAAAVATIAWLMTRRRGAPGAALAMAGATLLTWSMGSEMLYDPWSQHAPLLPFALFLVAVWCVMAGDPVALPVMVAAGGYALQTHLSYTMLVPGLATCAVGALVTTTLWRRRNDPATWRRQRRRTWTWSAIAAGTWLAVAAQPLIEQLTAGGEGNLTALARSGGAEAPTPSHAASLRALAGTVALPPAWLPPSYGDPSFHFDGSGRPTWLAGTSLAALALLLVTLAGRAWRRRSPTVVAGTTTALVALALGFLSIDEAPTRWGLAPTYVRWMWPLGMVVWLVVAVAVVDELTARRHDEARTTARRAAATGLAIAAVAAIATLPTVDNGAASPPWTVDAAHQIDDEVVAAVEGEPGVLVEMSDQVAVGATGPALFVALQRAGIPFYVDDVPLVRQLGPDRAYLPGDATVRLTVRSGRDDVPALDERLIAESRPRVAAHERDPRPDEQVIKVYRSPIPSPEGSEPGPTPRPRPGT